MVYSNLKPFWIRDIDKARLLDSADYLLPDPKREIILSNVNLENLIDLLKDGNRDALKVPGLFKKGFNDKKTEVLINLWRRGVKVLPPSVMFSQKLDGIVICYGRHRINVALFLGATHIPVVISLNENNIMEHLLEIKKPQ